MLALLLAAASLLSSAQTADDLATHAAVVFRGTVLSVEPVATAPDALPTVRIRFRVTEAFRGAGLGQELTITEWQGLWTTGDRYRVGEDALLFLYPAAVSGLTSPVSGQSGHIVIPAAASRPDRESRPPEADPAASRSREALPADSKSTPSRRRVDQP